MAYNAQNNDLVDRMVGTLKVTVIRAYGLKDVAVFGVQNPQVSISVNSDKKYTSTKDDAGSAAEWNEILTFNLDCQVGTTRTRSASLSSPLSSACATAFF